jgi:hypothetical protein
MDGTATSTGETKNTGKREEPRHASEADLFTGAFSGLQEATQRSFQAWVDNLAAGATAARELQAHSAEFGRKAMELNVQAARTLGSTAAPLPDRLSAQMNLGASAMELYLAYLGKSAELVTRSFAPRGGRPD